MLHGLEDTVDKWQTLSEESRSGHATDYLTIVKPRFRRRLDAMQCIREFLAKGIDELTASQNTESSEDQLVKAAMLEKWTAAAEWADLCTDEAEPGVSRYEDLFRNLH